MTPKQLQTIAMIHSSLSNGIRSGKADVPREWLAARNLSIELTCAVFNSGQIHHRKEQQFLDDLEEVGFLKISPVGTNTGKPGYTIFAPQSILFPLKNEFGQVVNYYAISLRNGKAQYLNKEGVYPQYPSPTVKNLYITEDVVGAATILEGKILDNQEGVIALRDGEITQEHIKLLQRNPAFEKITYIG